MNSAKHFLILLISVLALTSCLMTESVRSIQVEVMKPAILTLPEECNTVAIFKRDLFQSDTVVYRYLEVSGPKLDTSVHYADLSVYCVDALAETIKKEGYFSEVKNYRDSLNHFWNNRENRISHNELEKNTQADIFIFLDYFHFNHTTFLRRLGVFDTYPQLWWTIEVKNDTASYVYNQKDTLSYEVYLFPEFFKEEKVKMNDILKDATEYLAKKFGSKLAPSWMPVERMYYTSGNPTMQMAEKFALQNEWMKAVEIWNRESKNKNKKIVAKATFNMAIACEMEGKFDLAIDWLVQSYSALPKNNDEHKASCQRYIHVLALRRKEVEKLSKQVRN